LIARLAGDEAREERIFHPGDAGWVVQSRAGMNLGAGSGVAVRRLLAFLGQQIAHRDREIAKRDTALMAQNKANPVTRLLAGIPGIGPIGALPLALRSAPASN
jgi:transposase